MLKLPKEAQKDVEDVLEKLKSGKLLTPNLFYSISVLSDYRPLSEAKTVTYHTVQFKKVDGAWKVETQIEYV